MRMMIKNKRMTTTSIEKVEGKRTDIGDYDDEQHLADSNYKH